MSLSYRQRESPLWGRGDRNGVESPVIGCMAGRLTKPALNHAVG